MEHIIKRFNCETCAYSSDKLSEWSKHIATRKHLSIEREKSPTKYSCCHCNKEYSVRSSLWYHQKKCTPTETVQLIIEPEKSPQHIIENKYIDIVNRLITDNQRIIHDNNELRNLILAQSKITTEQNNEILNKMIECCKPTVIQTINNTQNNNNNKFNINVYLNETCKDAMNFSDFIENIDVSYEDLENNVQLGFVNGIAKIFMDNLKQLKLHERPIHCTDVKREIMYLKENNVWTKQLNTDKLNNAVNIISNKGIKKLMMWKRENPDYQDVNSEFSNKCLDIQLSTMAGYNLSIYNPKVIHVIARETAITRGTYGS